jgi:hypothetical protein
VLDCRGDLPHFRLFRPFSVGPIQSTFLSLKTAGLPKWDAKTAPVAHIEHGAGNESTLTVTNAPILSNKGIEEVHGVRSTSIPNADRSKTPQGAVGS